MFLNLATNPGLLWFIAGLAMLITELFAPSLVLMFFGLGAWVVTVLYLVFNIGFSAQLIVFGAASLLLLALLVAATTKAWCKVSETQSNTLS